METVLDILSGLRLTGSIFLDAEFTAPWCVTAKVGPEDCSPFVPEPRNIIAYHYVSVGKLLLEVDGAPPVCVRGGEIVVLPRNDTHRLGSSLGLRPVSAEHLIQPGTNGGLARIVHGGGGERTHIVCGFLGSSSANEPLLTLLPKVLKIAVLEGASGPWIESAFRFAAQEFAAGRTQSPTVLAKLAELLFLEAIRQYLLSLPPGQTDRLDGLSDPVIGRALGVLHGQMGRAWTAEELAREVGLSRSAFAARFTQVMGEPPMRYLAKWRLQSAAQRLTESQEPIARIAYASGYESEAAFSRAFSRAFGMPPATWRKQHLNPAAVGTD